MSNKNRIAVLLNRMREACLDGDEELVNLLLDNLNSFFEKSRAEQRVCEPLEKRASDWWVGGCP